MLRYADAINYPIAPRTQRVTERDLLLYALAVGAGADLPDEQALPFVYEKALTPLATYYAILTWSDPSWLSAVGIDVPALVHVGESLEIHAPLSAGRDVRVETRIGGIIDKGRERGAIVDAQFVVRDAASGDLMARASSQLFCRKDGGVEGAPPSPPPPAKVAWPDGAPSGAMQMATRQDQAALYRLCGDMNPIHIDPDVAVAAGFARPLMHGLCTYGMSYMKLVRACFDGDVTAIRNFSVRFVGPAYPGEVLELTYWQNGADLQFRLSAAASRVVLEGHAVTQPVRH